MALTDKLSAIGDAVRNKTGSSDLMTLDQMATAIDNIQIQQPFDLNAVNQILSTIKICAPQEYFAVNNDGSLRSIWPYYSVEYGATIQNGYKMTYAGYNSPTFRVVFELPSMNIPDGYVIKFDYEYRWIKPDSSTDTYGTVMINIGTNYTYTDNTREQIQYIGKSSPIANGSFTQTGILSYKPAGTIINDKTIYVPYLSVVAYYTQANSRTDNFIYMFKNFRVEPESQGE